MIVRIAVLAVCLCGASTAWAQEPAPQPTPVSAEQLDARHQELQRWLAQYRKWEKWIALNGNRAARSAIGGIVPDRLQRPEPPAWLVEDCAQLIGYDGSLGQACEILRRWRGLAWHLKRLNDNPVLTTTGGVTNDRVVKSSFWQRVHLTGLWTPGQIPVPPLFGVVGMQVGVVEIGRLTVPAIGVMLVTATNESGEREWKPATNIAISFRLRNFDIDGVTAALHFNVSRLEIRQLESVGPAAVPVSQNFIGLSLSFKKRH